MHSHRPRQTAHGLPCDEAKPQLTLPLLVMTLRLFRSVGSDNPGPALAQLIAAPWRISGDVYAGWNATLAFDASVWWGG
jgi:hypothetical protein